MYVIKWNTADDAFKNCFATCSNVESTWNLWWNLSHNASIDSSRASNIRVYDMTGNEINMNKGGANLAANGEWTHK